MDYILIAAGLSVVALLTIAGLLGLAILAERIKRPPCDCAEAKDEIKADDYLRREGLL